MQRLPRIGLLPLYLKLYDECAPKVRAEFAPFLDRIAAKFAGQGVEVVRSDICCVAAEFGHAVQAIEKQDVDLLVTVHLAYSPSLESIDALVKTALPILILDTTMDAAFGCRVKPERIMYNHGIHGVMDLACMLRRRGKPFEIVAGHLEAKATFSRAAEIARAACAARTLRKTVTMRVGGPFRGMGDFAVAEDVLAKKLGIRVINVGAADLGRDVRSVRVPQVAAEVAEDRKRFRCELPRECHERSVRVGLGLRRALEKNGCNAFSMNFLAFDSAVGPVNTVPFLEASKAMARGVGYAGEGDVLTAALVGALASAFGQTTFTEIFCPDWRGNSLFLSHMGEICPDVLAGKPRLSEKPYKFSAALNPAILTGRMQPGPAVFVNLVPGPSDRFSLIAAPVEVLADSASKAMDGVVRGWIRPPCPLPAFLEAYSRHGGTHHSALVLGERADAVLAFARFAGLDEVRIGGE